MFILITIFVNFALRHPEEDYLRNLWSLNGPDYLSISYLFKKITWKTIARCKACCVAEDVF